MNKRLAFILISILLLAVIFAVYYFGVMIKESNELLSSGTIEATEVEISSKVTGRVLPFLIEEGETVTKGQVITYIDSPELLAELRAAKSKLSLAKNELSRMKSLYFKGFISRSQYDHAKDAYEEAAATSDIVLTKLSDTKITAPVSGTLTLKSVEVGELVKGGVPIITIADLSKVYLMVYIPEKTIGRVALGEVAYVMVDSYPEEKFEGKITYISPKAEFTPKNIQTKEERVTQVFGVKIQIPNPSQKLKPGMPADAVIKLH